MWSFRWNIWIKFFVLSEDSQTHQLGTWQLGGIRHGDKEQNFPPKVNSVSLWIKVILQPLLNTISSSKAALSIYGLWASDIWDCKPFFPHSAFQILSFILSFIMGVNHQWFYQTPRGSLKAKITSGRWEISI